MKKLAFATPAAQLLQEADGGPFVGPAAEPPT